MFEPIVRVLPLGLQAGNTSTQTTGQESGTNSLCREPRRRRIDQRANAPIWMPTVLDSGFDPAYWQLEATLSKITGTSKRQHP